MIARARRARHDVVVTNPAGTDPAPWAEAGATWCLTGFGPQPTRREVERAIDQRLAAVLERAVGRVVARPLVTGSSRSKRRRARRLGSSSRSRRVATGAPPRRRPTRGIIESTIRAAPAAPMIELRPVVGGEDAEDVVAVGERDQRADDERDADDERHRLRAPVDRRAEQQQQAGGREQRPRSSRCPRCRGTSCPRPCRSARRRRSSGSAKMKPEHAERERGDADQRDRALGQRDAAARPRGVVVSCQQPW